MDDDQRREALRQLAYEGEGGPESVDFEVSDEDVARAREEAIASLIAAGISAEDAEAFARGENPFAKKKADDEGESDKDCSCDKVEGKHKTSAHKKTSGGSKKPPTEKKSEDDNSEVPAVESDDVEPRSEDPEDAAQAGTSTGMSSNARERALSLLDLI
jgi:hypothetical protein